MLVEQARKYTENELGNEIDRVSVVGLTVPFQELPGLEVPGGRKFAFNRRLYWRTSSAFAVNVIDVDV